MAGGLGRGLGSLIPQKVNKKPDDEVTPSVSIVDTSDKVLKVSPDIISANPSQPRQEFTPALIDELAASIKEYGILQPLVVSKKGQGYELISGERRLRAAKRINLKEVPVIVRDAGEQERLELALIENIQRSDLNAIELAMSYRKLMDEFNLSQEELSKRVAKSRPAVANTLRLLNLPSEIQKALASGVISEGHAKVLMGLDSEAKQMDMFRKITANKMTVQDTADMTRKAGGTKQARYKKPAEDEDKERRLEEFFNTKAKIRRKQKGGQIIVDFYSDEELGEIMKKIK